MGPVRDYLLPGVAERDASFRRELALRGSQQLRILGILQIAALLPDSRWLATAPLIGAVTCLLSWIKWTGSNPRWPALLSTFACAAIMTAAHAPQAQIAVIVLAAVGLVPFKPWQTAALGLAITAAGAIAGNSQLIFALVLAAVSTVMSVWLYAVTVERHEAHRRETRISAALAGAQLRAQLAENAAAIGKLASILTHEINSPLGTMKSSIDTLLALNDRPAAPAGEGTVRRMQAELRRSIASSSERVEELVERLQPFVDLNDTELKNADVNALIRQTILRLQGETPRRVRIQLDLGDLPPLNCRPSLLSTAISYVLKNAIDAVNGDGRIRITTRRLDSLVEIRIEDNGRGMPPEEIENIFDPGFKVSGKRVRSGNWSLFNLRQIVFLHGGDIQAASAAGKGTSISITLPCE